MASVTRRARRQVPVALAVALVCAACGGHAAEPDAALSAASVANRLGMVAGRFGGFVTVGSPRSVHARWRVPAIAGTSPFGQASTWVGVQAPGGSTAPFIQVGTLEVRDSTITTAKPGPHYAAFWSDTAEHFHSLGLFSVEAGDTVSATLTLSGGAWHVAIRDLTHRAAADFRTRQEGNGHFNEAEWVQEDLTSLANGAAAPYPEIAPVRFSQLTVDGAPPARAALRSQWLDALGRMLGPGPLRHDSFAMVPQSLSRDAVAYLRAISGQDRAATRVDALIASYRPGSDPTALDRASTAYIAAVGVLNAQLRARRWPPAVAPLMLKLRQAGAYAAARQLAAQRAGPDALARLSANRTPYGSIATIAAQIRLGLGAPQIPSSGG